jgi:hypothetical protein
MSVACNMIFAEKMKSTPGITALVIKAVVIATVKKKAVWGIRFKFFFSKQF